VTLATFLLFFAAFDFALTLVIAMAVARKQAELPVDRRGPVPQFIVGAGYIAAIILCVLAFLLPDADLVIL
jgi:hypothetical protein